MSKNALLVSLDSDLGKYMKRVLDEEGYDVTSTSRNGLAGTTHFELTGEVPNFNPGSFDILVYNLGVVYYQRNRVDIIRMNAILATDALEKLALSMKPGGRIIVFSSGWGSIKQTISSGDTNEVAYRMSKAALNMGVAVLSNRYSNLKWILMQPGFITTKMNTNKENRPSEDPYRSMQGVLKHSLLVEERYVYIGNKGEPF
jgi:NAD(P)-dependent dehydrogenase (short-subunit alcohol dehydrogenase family)